MDVQQSLRIIRRWIIVILATGAVAAMLAYVASGFLPRTYESRATLLIGQDVGSTRLDYTQILAAQLQAQTYAEIAAGRSVLETTIETLGLDTTPEELSRRMRVEAPSDSRFVEIIALDANPERAADIANAVADQMIALTAEGSADTNVATITQELTATEEEIGSAEAELEALAAQTSTAARTEQISALTDRILELRSIRAQLLTLASEGSTNPITIVSAAGASDEPTFPRPALNAVLAAIVGVIVAVVLALVVDRYAPVVERSSLFAVLTGRSERERA